VWLRDGARARGGVTEARDGENTARRPADRDATVAAVVRLLRSSAAQPIRRCGLETAARFLRHRRASSRLFATALAERGVALGEVG
jgi:hypothetical protein